LSRKLRKFLLESNFVLDLKVRDIAFEVRDLAFEVRLAFLRTVSQIPVDLKEAECDGVGQARIFLVKRRLNSGRLDFEIKEIAFECRVALLYSFPVLLSAYSFSET
jgi:hypothetical protein